MDSERKCVFCGKVQSETTFIVVVPTILQDDKGRPVLASICDQCVDRLTKAAENTRKAMEPEKKEACAFCGAEMDDPPMRFQGYPICRSCLLARIAPAPEPVEEKPAKKGKKKGA